MKINIYKVSPEGVNNVSREEDIYGNEIPQTIDPEEELIDAIDSEKMSEEKSLAVNFLKFLGNRRLSISDLKALPENEQRRLRREFIINN